jgi:hypothetical protein
MAHNASPLTPERMFCIIFPDLFTIAWLATPLAVSYLFVQLCTGSSPFRTLDYRSIRQKAMGP